LCRVEPLARVAEPAGRWLTADDLATAGLPAPIRRLLLSQLAPGQGIT
jgi:hypothetical protein